MDLTPVVASFRRASERLVHRKIDHLLHRGLYARPLDLERDRVALLFYEDFDADRVVRGDRHAVRLARTLVNSMRKGQKTTGFRVAFEALARALREAGWTVVENDTALARANPDYPVGIAGYPHILDRWELPNPAVLGPGLIDHPALRPELMNDPRFISYIVPSRWMQDLFETTYKDRCGTWFAGLDMNQWPDLSGRPKDLDFIIYDKIYWDQERVREEIRKPVETELTRRGLSFEHIVYRHYTHAEYRALLGRARGMVFLAANESQGLAYQEALSTGVPVLAWDSGFWHDPVRFKFGTDHVPASSVPYFKDGVTGERFKDPAGIPAALDRFLAGRATYTPRAYVRENLSLERSAAAYLKLYREAAASRR